MTDVSNEARGSGHGRVALYALAAGCLMALSSAFTYTLTLRPMEAPAPAQEESAGPVWRTPPDLPVVNAHDHLYREEHLEKYRKAAKRIGVASTLFVASSEYTIMGVSGDPRKDNDTNSREILRLAKKYPGEIIPFVTIHPDDPDKVALLEAYRAEGARGLKLYTGHGNFHDRDLNAPEMQPVYAWCEAEGFPLCWHINLIKYSDEFTTVMLNYPQLRVILPHFGVTFWRPGQKHWQELGRILDTYPNVVVDTSFGTREIMVGGLEKVSAQPEIFRAFYEKYQDRILWGTDMVVTGNREKTEAWITSVLRACRDMHEQEEYYCWMAAEGSKYAYKGANNTYGKLRGLALPDAILEKLYVTNFERFMNP